MLARTTRIIMGARAGIFRPIIRDGKFGVCAQTKSRECIRGKETFTLLPMRDAWRAAGTWPWPCRRHQAAEPQSDEPNDV